MTTQETLDSVSGRARMLIEARDMTIENLRSALREIARLKPEMIDVLPLDQAFSRLRQITKIATAALKE